MKRYYFSAMAVYVDIVEADTEEEAINKFCGNCPYDIDGNSIELSDIEEIEDEE